jgi:hypothetical protein
VLLGAPLLLHCSTGVKGTTWPGGVRICRERRCCFAHFRSSGPTVSRPPCKPHGCAVFTAQALSFANRVATRRSHAFMARITYFCAKRSRGDVHGK